MCGIIGKTNIVDVAITSGLARARGQIDIRVDTVAAIEIIGIGVLDSGLTDFCGPATIPTSDEQGVTQIARVSHSILLIGQNLVEQVGQFCRRRNRHTAVEHLRIEVAVVSTGIIEVGHLAGGRAAQAIGNVTRVTHVGASELYWLRMKVLILEELVPVVAVV